MKNTVLILTAFLFSVVLTEETVFAQQEALETNDTTYFRSGDDEYNLIESVIRNNLTAARMLINRVSDVDSPSETGNSALMYATEKRNLEMMQLLVNAGANVNFSGYNSETPLFIAIFNNDFQSAKYLLEKGADPNVLDDYGVTPLLYAAATNQYQSADLLLFYDADKNKRDKSGNDPLISAVTFENLETTDVLLQNGLDPDVQDNEGNTSIIIATQHGTYDIIELLLEYEANVNIANNKNYTALAYALTYNDVRASNMLLEKGANANHQIEKGTNLYDLARKSGNDTLVDLIRENGGSQLKQLDFSEFNFLYGNSFNKTDYLIGFRGGMRDSKYNFFFETGIDYRPFLLKINTVINDTLYQFRERRIGWSHGIRKYQELISGTNGFSAGIYLLVSGYLSFPNYKGTSYGSKVNYTLMPSAGIMANARNIGVRAGIDWYDFDNLLDKKLKYNVTFFFRITYPEGQYDRKEIYWE